MRKQYMDFVPSKAPAKKRTEVVRELPVRERPVRGLPRNGYSVEEPVIETYAEEKYRVAEPPMVETPVVERRSSTATVRTSRSGSTMMGFSSEKVELGAIEDLSGKFVKTDVPKRPLGDGIYGGVRSESGSYTAARAGYSRAQATAGTVAGAKRSAAAAGRVGGVRTASATNRTVRTSSLGGKAVGNVSTGGRVAGTRAANNTGARVVDARRDGAAGRVAATRTVGTASRATGARAAVSSQTYRPPRNQFINQEKVQKRPLSKNVYQKKVESPAKEEPEGPVTIITKPEKQAHVSLIVTIILTIILGAAAGTIAFLLLPK